MLAPMRTAVVRVDVDPDHTLSPEQLRDCMTALLERVGPRGVVAPAAASAGLRELELLLVSGDADSARQQADELCRSVFRISPKVGVVTFVSRGTDDDAHGVLAGFGLTGEVRRTPGTDGFDIVDVTVAEADLDRIPESRIHTALEASLNCEVRIHTV